MNTLTADMVYYQPKYIPANLHIWQDENSGVSALTNAANAICNGETVRFAICDREGTKAPTIHAIVTIAMGKDSPRYCGEDQDPEGAGSHSLIASWYDYCKDPAAIAVAMARAFGEFYFRLA